MKLPTFTICKSVVDNCRAGTIVAAKRRHRKMSVRMLAKRMKISATFLSQLENGKRNWTEERFKQVMLHLS